MTIRLITQGKYFSSWPKISQMKKPCLIKMSRNFGQAKWRPPWSLVLFHVDNWESMQNLPEPLTFEMTTTCWLWSTLEKACLKRAMALHRDSGRSDAACAKAVADDQLVTWDTWRPACHAMPTSYWSEQNQYFSYWISNSHLVRDGKCNSTH